ncbi:hypothetical protein [Deinococcus hopiensis]|uniref:Uncharacterized protein n=1 Tax=Deinococcus hopiensis KR-140 TaxID=695939 RepID=A0A1W1UPX2_9DEIO|nr:hypothetical protein [Deinococcus hopiensis]SMB83083.1 hypothetical protein SAMN00790413_04253 [Deinococcus hopiensis KR-140]
MDRDLQDGLRHVGDNEERRLAVRCEYGGQRTFLAQQASQRREAEDLRAENIRYRDETTRLKDLGLLDQFGEQARQDRAPHTFAVVVQDYPGENKLS